MSSNKQLIPDYIFSAAAKTVTLTKFTAIELKRVLLITNVTDGLIIYNFADPLKGGTVAGNVLTLTYNTTTMSDTDDLAIMYETKIDDPDYARYETVETERVTWRRNFNGASLNTDYWDIINNGVGQVINGGGGNLQITAGTTANSETTIRSKQAFQLPFRVQFMEMQSQRIANNNFYLELINAAGDTYIGWMFDGTTTTQAKTIHMNGGYSAPASPTAAVTVAASSSSTPVIREIDCRVESANFLDRSSDSPAAATSRVVKTRSTLDPHEDYFIQIRVANGSTAPATSTTYTLESVLVQDSTKLVAEISGGRGNSAANQSIPVNIASSISLTTVNAASTSTGLTSNFYTATTPLVNTKTSVKTSATGLYYINVKNNDTVDVWLQCFNVALASVTVGTTVPTNSFFVPAGGSYIEVFDKALIYSTALVIACTTGERNNTAPATGATVNLRYV